MSNAGLSRAVRAGTRDILNPLCGAALAAALVHGPGKMRGRHGGPFCAEEGRFSGYLIEIPLLHYHPNGTAGATRGAASAQPGTDLPGGPQASCRRAASAATGSVEATRGESRAKS